MSGGGGGGGGGSSPRPPDCGSLILRTHLNSPQPAVVRTLRARQVLQVQLQQSVGRTIVVALTASGQVAGSITGAGLGMLIQCLRDGHDFVAVVENVAGGSVEVTVRPR